MLNAISNIYSINKLVEQSSDDQIIRATNIQLKTDDSTKTYFYVRKNKIDQIFQKLTDWTDGAKAKQALAKNQIISNLKIIKDNPEFDKKFPNKDRREQALALMNKIIMTVNTTEKDITSSMIKKDLLSLNSFLRTYETIEKKSEHSDPVEDSSEGDVANSEAESDLNAAKRNNTDSNITELARIDIDEGFTVVMQPSETDNFENNIKATISKNMSSYLSKLTNVTSLDVAEVVFNSEDPEVDGSPYKETNSQPAEIHLMREILKVVTIKEYESEQVVSPSANLTASIKVAEVVLNNLDPLVNGKPAETINTTPIPIGETIEQDMDASEAATENTPSPAPSAPSSSAETKNTAKANPHLASLQSKWRPIGNGYHQITELFSITAGISTSSMIADAYLLPSDMRLTFQGKKTDTKIKSGIGNLVKGQHTFPKNPFNTRPNINSRESNYDTDRPYTQISVTRPPKIISFDALTKDQEDEFKAKLDAIYKSSIENIVKEHKNDNNDEDPKSLVITPIFQDVAKVSSVEINSLVDAIINAQASNPKLNINISAGSDNHKKLIQEAFEKKMSQSI